MMRKGRKYPRSSRRCVLVYCLTSSLIKLCPQTFRGRLIEVIDQAQHFAALGTGGGGSTGDSAQAFREGLDGTERERELETCFLCHIITDATLASNGLQCSAWPRKVRSGQSVGMMRATKDGGDRVEERRLRTIVSSCFPQ